MRLILTALFMWLAAMQAGLAQNSYNAILTVNGDAITAFELEQRKKMLQLFNTPGDLNTLAREQLIDDRLKMQELRRAGLRLTDEKLREEMTGFASRANMSLDQFLGLLAQGGVAEETFRDFVRVGVSWRDYAREKFRPQLQVRPADVNRALGQGSNVQMQILLSEIIIPAPPQLANRAMAEARRIAALRSQSAFSAAAQQVSALPSRDNGGRLGWVPISNFPAQLRPVLLALGQNEVTAPIQIDGAIALFQMRGLRELERPAPRPTEIDYLTFSLPGGLSDATQAEAARITDHVDTCDDFYGIARGLPEERLQRQSVAPATIPRDIAQVLAGLDDDELSYGLTRNGGQTMLMVMMCKRSYAAPGDEIDTEAVTNQLAGQQLESLSGAYLADLRARAIIR